MVKCNPLVRVQIPCIKRVVTSYEALEERCHSRCQGESDLIDAKPLAALITRQRVPEGSYIAKGVDAKGLTGDLAATIRAEQYIASDAIVEQ